MTAPWAIRMGLGCAGLTEVFHPFVPFQAHHTVVVVHPQLHYAANGMEETHLSLSRCAPGSDFCRTSSCTALRYMRFSISALVW